MPPVLYVQSPRMIPQTLSGSSAREETRKPQTAPSPSRNRCEGSPGTPNPNSLQTSHRSRKYRHRQAYKCLKTFAAVPEVRLTVPACYLQIASQAFSPVFALLLLFLSQPPDLPQSERS